MMRRSLLGLLAGLPLAGDGLIRPQNAPIAQQPGVGVQPGTTSAVVLANTVIVFGPSGSPVGVFVYQPGTTPGPGNVPVLSMTEALFDPYGNAVQGGFTARNPSVTPPSYIQVQAGSPPVINISTGDAAESSPGLLTSIVEGSGVTRAVGSIWQAPRVSGEPGSANASIIVQSPSVDLSTFPANVVIAAEDGAANSTQVQVKPTVIQLTGPVNASAAVTATGGTESAPTLVTTDTWQTVPGGSFGTGFQAGNPVPKYALLPWGVNGAGCVMLRGQVLANAATAANAVMFTVPFTFPAQDQSFVTPTNAAGYAAGNRVVKAANGTGNVELAVTAANTNFILLDGVIIPLG